MIKSNTDLINNGLGFYRDAEKRYAKLEPVMDSAIWAPNGFCPIRVSAKLPQIHGVDWIDAKSGIRVDDKARMIYNPNYGLADKFNVEIFSANCPEGVGWLFHSDSWASHYAFITGRVANPDWDFVAHLRVILVEKSALKEFLAGYGCISVQSVVDMLEENGRERDVRGTLLAEFHLDEGVVIQQFVYSYEHPINISVGAKHLQELGTTFEWIPG